MRIVFLFAMLLSITGNAQDFSAPINRIWAQYAGDTALTYCRITHVCDSMFSEAGFANSDTAIEGFDSVVQKQEGSSFWNYCLWKAFWYSRCDSDGRLHDIVGDAKLMLNAQNKTTSVPTSCLVVPDVPQGIWNE